MNVQFLISFMTPELFIAISFLLISIAGFIEHNNRIKLERRVSSLENKLSVALKILATTPGSQEIISAHFISTIDSNIKEFENELKRIKG